MTSIDMESALRAKEEGGGIEPPPNDSIICPHWVMVKIVRVDNARINDAIHRGFIYNIPNTVKGLARYYNLKDLVGISFVARLMDLGVSPRKAGAWASSLSLYSASSIAIARFPNDTWAMTPTEMVQFEKYKPTMTLIFDVNEIKEDIIRRFDKLIPKWKQLAFIEAAAKAKIKRQTLGIEKERFTI